MTLKSIQFFLERSIIQSDPVVYQDKALQLLLPLDLVFLVQFDLLVVVADHLFELGGLLFDNEIVLDIPGPKTHEIKQTNITPTHIESTFMDRCSLPLNSCWIFSTMQTYRNVPADIELSMPAVRVSCEASIQPTNTARLFNVAWNREYLRAIYLGMLIPLYSYPRVRPSAHLWMAIPSSSVNVVFVSVWIPRLMHSKNEWMLRAAWVSSTLVLFLKGFFNFGDWIDYFCRIFLPRGL